jgi:hypothetical protein
MIALHGGKVEGQILIEKVPFYGAIDHLPAIRGKRCVETPFKVVVDGLVVADSPAIVNFRIEGFAAIGDRGAEQEYANDARLLFRRNIVVGTKSGSVELNMVAVVTRIITKRGPAVELQLDAVARRAGLPSRYVFRESEHCGDNGNIVENEQDGLKSGSHHLLPMGPHASFRCGGLPPQPFPPKTKIAAANASLAEHQTVLFSAVPKLGLSSNRDVGRRGNRLQRTTWNVVTPSIRKRRNRCYAFR